MRGSPSWKSGWISPSDCSPSVMRSACPAGGTTDAADTIAGATGAAIGPDIVIAAGGGGPSMLEAISICVLAVSFAFVAYKLLLPAG